MQEYVIGLLFDRTFTVVGLIRKNRPAWQAGKLNGIGGKVEGQESPINALVREFEEETSYTSKPEDWNYYAKITGKDFVIYCFAAIGTPHTLKTMEDEVVEIVNLKDITREEVVENLPRLISLGLAHLQCEHPSFTEITY